MTPEDILDQLHGTTPQQLDQLPAGQGIYALYDHEHKPRYIGITQMGLYERIHGYHAGGDGNSHKFSTVYNAGRMFHTSKDPRSDPEDGKTAKELRRLFARSRCRAVGVELLDLDKHELRSIEAQVIALASAENTSWNHARALPTVDLGLALDEFLDEIGWSAAQREAIERQAARWRAKTV